MEEKQEQREVRESLKKGFVINSFFPCQSIPILEKFLSRADGKYTEKKDAFELYLNSVCTVDFDMDTFAAGLLKALFSKNFIRDHRWPTAE